MVLRFVTDSTSEREGFDITWRATNVAMVLAQNPIISGPLVFVIAELR